MGKRAITLLSLGGCALSTFLLAGIAGDFLQPSWTNGVMLFYSFVSSLGVGPIPWMLQSELYPFQGKCLAAGIAAAGAYIIGFGATKTYLYLQSLLTLFGVFVLFGALSLVGCVGMYWFLPETEGRFFNEIAKHFDKPKNVRGED